MAKIPLKDTEWKKVNYLGSAEDGYEYELVLPRPLADWDVYDYWERDRIRSMQRNLTDKTVVWDIGAEHGWLSVVIAKIVGGENMVLVEPTASFWPNIRATWEKNGLATPKASFVGLVGAETAGGAIGYRGEWPPESEGDLIDRNAYEYLHEANDCDRSTIDELRRYGKITPDALNIDVEGAELEVLKGSFNTLNEIKPLVWLSVHPDLMERDYGHQPGEVKKFMRDLGYVGRLLGTDHEQHWFYYHPDGAKRAVI